MAKSFIEKGFNRFLIGGKFYMVTKRKEWYKDKFISIFGGVKIYEKKTVIIYLKLKKETLNINQNPKRHDYDMII